MSASIFIDSQEAILWIVSAQATQETPDRHFEVIHVSISSKGPAIIQISEEDFMQAVFPEVPIEVAPCIQFILGRERVPLL